MEVWSAPGRSKPTFDEAKRKLESGQGRKVEIGFQFGPSCEHLFDLCLTWLANGM